MIFTLHWKLTGKICSSTIHPTVSCTSSCFIIFGKCFSANKINQSCVYRTPRCWLHSIRTSKKKIEILFLISLCFFFRGYFYDVFSDHFHVISWTAYTFSIYRERKKNPNYIYIIHIFILDIKQYLFKPIKQIIFQKNKGSFNWSTERKMNWTFRLTLVALFFSQKNVVLIYNYKIFQYFYYA